MVDSSSSAVSSPVMATVRRRQHVGRGAAQNVSAQNLAVRFAHQHFYEAVGRRAGARAPVGAEGEAADLELEAGFLGLLLGQPDGAISGWQKVPPGIA